MIRYLHSKGMDIGQLVIVVSLLSISIIHAQTDGLKIDGHITISNPSGVYKRGDNLTFTFNALFNVTNDTEVINVTIWSPTLQFLNTTPQWTLYGLDIDPALGSEPRYDPSSDIVSEEMIEENGSYVLNLQNINTNRWNFNGTFQMMVRDDVGHGRRIQTFMDFKIPILEGNSSVTTTLPSTYGYTSPMQLEIIPPANVAIGIRKKAMINVSLTLTEDHTAPMVEIMTPYERTSREVMLTTLSIDVNDTYGLEDYVVEEMGLVKPTVKSTFSSYQRDISIIQLPLLRNVMGVSESGFSVKATVRLEDYADMVDQDNLTIGTGVKFGDGMILVSDTTLIVDAPDAETRKPYLVMYPSTSTVCSGQDSNDVNFQIPIHHGTNSTATAYDLQLNLYPLPSMTHIATYANSPVDYSFMLNYYNGFTITLQRLTFSDPAYVKVHLDIPMDHRIIQDLTSFIVPVELIYTDRWNTSLDQHVPLKYMTVTLNNKCAERYTWTGDATCPCAFNSSRSDCGCCVDHQRFNVSQCGEENPTICAPDHKPWLCWTRKEGFLSTRKLPGFNSDRFECDASQKYSLRRNSEISCYKKSSAGYTALHPMVGVILGKDTASRSLYGVSRLGHAYIVSTDEGKTWATIRDAAFLKATSSPTYIASDLY